MCSFWQVAGVMCFSHSQLGDQGLAVSVPALMDWVSLPPLTPAPDQQLLLPHSLLLLLIQGTLPLQGFEPHLEAQFPKNEPSPPVSLHLLPLTPAPPQSVLCSGRVLGCRPGDPARTRAAC